MPGYRPLSWNPNQVPEIQIRHRQSERAQHSPGKVAD